MRILNKIEIQFTLNKRKATETHSTRELKHSHTHRRKERRLERRGWEEERRKDEKTRWQAAAKRQRQLLRVSNERDKKMCEKKQKKVFKWTQNWL